jgi:hypothetical protein
MILKSLPLTTPMTPLIKSLIISLHNCSPYHREKANSCGWRDSKFMVMKGYLTLLEDSISFPQSSMWKHIWHNDGLPKVNVFCWLLAHMKVITLENIRKHGIAGPSRCAICLNHEEMIQHLFVDFFFAKEFWTLFLDGLMHRFNWNRSCFDF